MRLRPLALTLAALAALEGAAAWRERAVSARGAASVFVDAALVDPAALARAERIVVREKPQTKVVHREEGFEVRRVAEPDAPIRETVLTRSVGGAWVVSNYLDLPADMDWVGQTMRDLSQGRLLRFVTDDPALMDDLGFDGTLVRLEDARGQLVRQIELGRKDGGDTYQLVRIDGHEAYVAKHEAEIVGDPLAWVVTRLLRFTSEDVRELELPVQDPGEPPVVLGRAQRGAPLAPAFAVPDVERISRRVEAVLETLLAEPMMLAVAHDHPGAVAARRNVVARLRLVLFDGRRYEVGYGVAPSAAPALSAEMRNEDLIVMVIESTDPEDVGRSSAARVTPVYARATTLGRLPRGRAALLAPDPAPAAGGRR